MIRGMKIARQRMAIDFHLSVAIPTLVFPFVATRTTQASRDQVQTVGGLDPASQLLAPAAYRFLESNIQLYQDTIPQKGQVLGL